MLTTANSCRLHRTPSILTPTLSTSQFPDKSSSDFQFYGLCHGLPLKTRVAKAIRYGRLNKPAAVSWITEKGSDYLLACCWKVQVSHPRKELCWLEEKSKWSCLCSQTMPVKLSTTTQTRLPMLASQVKKKRVSVTLSTCSFKIQSANHLKRNVRGEQGLALFQGMSFLLSSN